jgi:acyl-CoA thioesterase II
MTLLLAELLTPVADGNDRFLFPMTAEPWPRLYGGQLLGQACAAAGVTVEGARGLHSFHAYFLRSGDPRRPVMASVERERDGQRFGIRHVVLRQDGQDLLRLTASYHDAEAGWRQDSAMPAVASPEALDDDRDRVFDAIGDLPRSVALPSEILRDLDYRIAHTGEEDDRSLWVRVATPLTDARWLREAAIAYLSDFTLIGAALLRHRQAEGWAGIRGGSLDHALWLHRDPDPGEWLLYAQQGVWTGGARGLAQGRLFDRAGHHIASVMQEASVRPC